MSTTLVVYESKYGLTERMARDLGRVLGPARVCRATDLASVAPGAGVCHEALTAATFVVVVAPVYRHRPDQRIIDFVMDAQGWLRARRVALVCVGLATSAGAVRTYLEPLSSVLGASVVWTGGLGGRVALNWLDTADRQEIEASGELRGHRGLDDLDSFSAEALAEAALAIKAVRDRYTNAMPPAELRRVIEDFLVAHTTCTLCTGAGEHVRATPLEYAYQSGVLYLVSEGGEKFAHLLVNPRVSVAVYDDFCGMDRLAGLQMLGVAAVLDDAAPERASALALRGLDEVRLAAMPYALNLIRVRIERAEFLWSRFRDQGYDLRQTLAFPAEGEYAAATPRD